MVLVHGQKPKGDAEKASPDKQNARYSKWWVSIPTGVILISAFYFGPPLVLTPASLGLQSCLDKVCDGRPDCVRYSGKHNSHYFRFLDDSHILNTWDDMSYFRAWVRPWNLAQDVIPVAVIRPTSAQEVAAVVNCGAQHNVKVQARSGGHSYANHGLGGQNGSISIDLVNFQYVYPAVSETSWQAHIGAGTKLGEIDDILNKEGRSFAHGVCPGVGIGGHATIGGLGPMSRIWGATLDHIDEVEVITANGQVVRANTRNNSDLFFALRGAGAGFGIVTEFVMKTHPVPKDVIHYSYNFQFSRFIEAVGLFSAWQSLVAGPTLDPRLGTEFILSDFGAVITGTFYGSEKELRSSGLLDRLPRGRDPIALRRTSWEGSLQDYARREALYAADIPSKFISKNLAFTRDDMIAEAHITDLFGWIDEQPKVTHLWSIIFDTTGGVISKVPMESTAYAHRDKFMFYQSYGINVGDSSATKSFLNGFHDLLLRVLPDNRTYGTYPGYVDPYLTHPQQSYWMSNLPVLERVKAKWDPMDLFHNPQSVRPAAP